MNDEERRTEAVIRPIQDHGFTIEDCGSVPPSGLRRFSVRRFILSKGEQTRYLDFDLPMWRDITDEALIQIADDTMACFDEKKG